MAKKDREKEWGIDIKISRKMEGETKQGREGEREWQTDIERRTEKERQTDKETEILIIIINYFYK